MATASPTSPDNAATFLDDRRIDPRIRAAFAAHPRGGVLPSVENREQLLEFEATEEGRARAAAAASWFDRMSDQSVVDPSAVTVSTDGFVSRPDGNYIRTLVVRPPGEATLPVVYYIHGGAQAIMSCFDKCYSVWCQLIAQQGVAVVAVDFRNCLRPSSAAEVAPYPAGLNDCISGVEWLHANAAVLGVDSTRIVVAGDSGGGNLALATSMALLKRSKIHLIKGVYALCPHISGRWPNEAYPSSQTENGIFHNLHHNRARVAYGIEAFNDRDPLAWPSFAAVEDVAGLPPTVVTVNECDPLRDEGVEFYRLLLSAGVNARCRELIGTIHATEIFTAWCPDISREAARMIADFAKA